MLQVSFDCDLDEGAWHERSTAEVFKVFWAVLGLRWMFAFNDPDRRKRGGVFLFKDRASAEAFRDGPIAMGLKHLAGTRNHELHIFELRTDVSAITGAPLYVEMSRGELPPEVLKRLSELVPRGPSGPQT